MPSHLLGERRLRQPIEQRDDRALPAADRAREPLAVAHERAAGRQVGVAADAELREPVVGHDDPAVAELHVDGIVRRRRLELGLRRPAALRELQLVPAAGDDEPAAGRPALRGGADSPQRLAQRARADPVHLGAEGQRRADGVQVRVDEPRDDRAPAELDDARRRAPRGGESRPCCQAPRILPSRIASASRTEAVRVDRHDLAVEQHEVGRLRDCAARVMSAAASSATAKIGVPLVVILALSAPARVPCRASRRVRCCFTSGHSLAMMLYITTSRAEPSRRVPKWRMTPSFLCAERFDRALRDEIELVGAKADDLAAELLERVREQQQLAARVDVAALPALRVPRVADLDAIDVGDDVVKARAADDRARSRGCARPTAACGLRSWRASAVSMYAFVSAGAGTTVNQSSHSAPSAAAAARSRSWRGSSGSSRTP